MSRRQPIPDDLKELRQLVRDGKLFAVQKWIADGKRTEAPESGWPPAIELAMDTGFHSMVEVFLQHGADQAVKDGLLDDAVGRASMDFIQLLVQYGADPGSIDSESVFDTGNAEIIDYFIERGIDLDTGQPFANALCNNPCKPQLRIYLQYRDKHPTLRHQLNVALKHHAQEGNLRWVALLLWAGGDPRVRLPDIDNDHDDDPDFYRTALEEAVSYRRETIIDKIGIDPKRDDVDRLFEIACSTGNLRVIEKVFAKSPNPQGKNNSGEPMDRAISHLEWEMLAYFGARSEYRVKEALAPVLRLGDMGARWRPTDLSLKGFRRAFFRYDIGLTEYIIRKFHKHQVCDNDTLIKLISSPKMKSLLGERRATLISYLTTRPSPAQPKPAPQPSTHCQ
jgi:hypothetical protein